MSTGSETIAALATPPGRGGVGIIRISGPRAGEMAEKILGRRLRPRYAEYLPFMNSCREQIDEGIALWFPGPHSFTGEDVLELQGHGGPVVMDMLLSTLFVHGVRPARPGEFSERAFLNDKLDLAQAEAIVDLIDAGSEQAARSALRSLQGQFSERIHRLVEELIELRIYVESAIDFPEEEVDFLADSAIAERLNGVIVSVAGVQREARQGQILREGMTVVLAGRPNAGKSSLLNALAGSESAIVTDIPGTTRDVLREQIDIDGMPLHIIDTAGLRESGDAIEQEGIRRAWTEIERADRLLLVVDEMVGIGDQELAILEQLPDGLARTIVHNKVDLSPDHTPPVQHENEEHLYLSAKEGSGLDELRSHLKAVMGYSGGGEGTFMARRRHLTALKQAAEHLDSGEQLLATRQGELLAEELRLAQQQLGEITGEFSADDLLGRIFESFCIGK